MKTKDSRAINAEVPFDNLSPRYNESMEIEKRLPEDVIPKKYVITISPDFNKNEFHGNVRIDLELLNVSNFDMINKMGFIRKILLAKNLKIFFFFKESKSHRFTLEGFNHIVD